MNYKTRNIFLGQVKCCEAWEKISKSCRCCIRPQN